jgi:hypothetical protein
VDLSTLHPLGQQLHLSRGLTVCTRLTELLKFVENHLGDLKSDNFHHLLQAACEPSHCLSSILVKTPVVTTG